MVDNTGGTSEAIDRVDSVVETRPANLARKL